MEFYCQEEKLSWLKIKSDSSKNNQTNIQYQHI